MLLRLSYSLWFCYIFFWTTLISNGLHPVWHKWDEIRNTASEDNSDTFRKFIFMPLQMEFLLSGWQQVYPQIVHSSFWFFWCLLIGIKWCACSLLFQGIFDTEALVFDERRQVKKTAVTSGQNCEGRCGRILVDESSWMNESQRPAMKISLIKGPNIKLENYCIFN